LFTFLENSNIIEQINKQETEMNTLYIVRGVSGAGKTTFVKNLVYGLLCAQMFAADDYFTDSEGNYNFDASKLKLAHDECHANVRKAMNKKVPHVFVHNTFTQEWEMEKYFKSAEEFGYRVVSLIVENRHGNENSHNVPKETIQKMKDRFEVKL